MGALVTLTPSKASGYMLNVRLARRSVMWLRRVDRWSVGASSRACDTE